MFFVRLRNVHDRLSETLKASTARASAWRRERVGSAGLL